MAWREINDDCLQCGRPRAVPEIKARKKYDDYELRCASCGYRLGWYVLIDTDTAELSNSAANALMTGLDLPCVAESTDYKCIESIALTTDTFDAPLIELIVHGRPINGAYPDELYQMIDNVREKI